MDTTAVDSRDRLFLGTPTALSGADTTHAQPFLAACDSCRYVSENRLRWLASGVVRVQRLWSRSHDPSDCVHPTPPCPLRPFINDLLVEVWDEVIATTLT